MRTNVALLGARCDTSLKRKRRPQHASPLTLRVAIAALALFIGGCGSSHPTTVRVSGRITFEGRAWPVGGRLYFNSVEPAAGFPRHSGMAEFGTDGRFVATSWNKGDGLVPGKYKVGVECWKVPPTMGGPPEVSYVADSHLAAARSPIELTVEAGKPLSGLEWNIPKNPRAQ
jgi:hypothetical protein